MIATSIIRYTVDSKTDEYHEGQRVIVIPFPGTGGLCEYVLSAPGRIAVLPEYGGLDEWGPSPFPRPAEQQRLIPSPLMGEGEGEGEGTMTTAKPILRTGMRMSVDEFLDLPETDDKLRLELDDGELYVMPRPRRVHQFLALKLGTYFVNYLDSFTEPPAEVYFELVTILSREPRRVLVPDLCIFLREHTDIFVSGYAEGPPDIVIEILSSDRNRDLVRKRQLYAEVGVPEYWIFDYENDTVTPLELQGGEYAERSTLGVDDTLTTALLPGLAIPLADLFHHRQRPRDD